MTRSALTRAEDSARPGPTERRRLVGITIRSVRPRQLLLRTEGQCDFDPEHLLHVFSEQRRRFVSILKGFGSCDWSSPTRCADWSAHEVVRHLCDANSIAAGQNVGALDIHAGFDPRTTPREWLAASAGESPKASLDRFVATTDELLVVARDRLGQRRRFDVRLPIGWMDWTVLILHAFWDSWIHERDVLLARGGDHPTDDDATLYAAAYGVFLAAVVASMFGDPVTMQLQLSGIGGGVFDLDSRGRVTLAVRRGPAVGSPAADVADALAGRSPIADALAVLPAENRAALSRLADLFHTPVDENPT
jgi:uncharacterized protein (TIGR03083 family)